MNSKRHVLRALTLAFAVALAFSAFAARGAQAGKWFINNAAFHGTQTITGSGGAGKLLSLGVNVECSGSTLTGNITELTKGLASVTATGCELLEGFPLELSKECNITAPDGNINAGKITALVKFTVFLHGGESYVLIEPDTEGTLNERVMFHVTVVDVISGSGDCVSAGLKPVKGTQVALILSPATEALKHEIHVISDEVRKALFAGDFLHIGANLVTLDTASAGVQLTSDSNWSYR